MTVIETNPHSMSPENPITTQPAQVIFSTSGHTRIRINNLYRNQPLKHHLEKTIARIKGLHTVKANPLTGKLLVRHTVAVTPSSVLAHVLECLKTRPNATEYSEAKEQPPASPENQLILHSEAGWHQIDPEETLQRLGSSRHRGLDQQIVSTRLEKYGLNQLAHGHGRADLDILLSQFISMPVGLLAASAVVSIATGGLVDAAAIAAVILINATIGFTTERQAEKTISALNKFTPSDACVIRDGAMITIPATYAVPGDILILQPGQYVAADARLLHSDHLSVDESSLTGESLPVKKRASTIDRADTPISERLNMVYMGTFVTGGSGIAVITATAYSTELGTIQRLVGETRPPETPMQQQLDTMGTQLALGSAAICGGVFAIGLLRGQPMLQMLQSATSLAVAAVPEGLPAVATTTLALGIRKMRQENVSIRQLNAVETLGAVKVFCLDKTGTLTVNRMSVVEIQVDSTTITVSKRAFSSPVGELDAAALPSLRKLLEIVVLCSDVTVAKDNDSVTFDGSPTEVAMLEAAHYGGIDIQHLRDNQPRLATQYRSDHRPYMVTLHQQAGEKPLLAVKGSPAEVLAKCNSQFIGDSVQPLNKEARDNLVAANAALAEKGLRILAVAFGTTEETTITDRDDLTWVGLVGMADPLREGMPELMHTLHNAGIQTVMITGDQSATAYSIGKQLNLSNGDPCNILDSTTLEQLPPELLSGLIKKNHVFARVSPAHKLQIIQAFQNIGNVVAMTGDGINDGPALKAADIGVAMGGAQTDVARSVSDVVVEDDNLQTMVNAIGQGRTIYRNIRKSIHYLLATNLSEIEIMLVSTALGFGQVLSPMHLLWINLMTDIWPGLAISMEPPEKNIMRQPPRAADEQILQRRDLLRIVRESGIITAGTLGSYLLGRIRYGAGAQANTLAFHTLVFAQLLHSLSCRSETSGLFSPQKLPPNPNLRLAIGGSAAIQLLAVFFSPVRRLLGATPLTVTDLMAVLGGAGIPLFVNEALKLTTRQTPTVNPQVTHPSGAPHEA